MKFLLALLLLIVLIGGGAAAWMWYGMTKPYQGFAAEGSFVDVPDMAGDQRAVQEDIDAWRRGGGSEERKCRSIARELDRKTGGRRPDECSDRAA